MITDLIAVLATDSALRAVKAPKAPIWVVCLTNTISGRTIYLDKYPTIKGLDIEVPPYTNVYFTGTGCYEFTEVTKVIPEPQAIFIQVTYL